MVGGAKEGYYGVFGTYKKFKIGIFFNNNVYLCSMVKNKGEEYKHHIIIHPDDFDKEGEIVDDNGRTIQALDIWEYCRFFAENIQLRIDDMFDGIDIMSFSDKHGFLDYSEDSKTEQRKAFMEKLFSFTTDGRICKFQKDMASIYKQRINAMALCALCLFINDIIHHKLVVLLKPTLEDVANGITKLKSVTFENEDGSTINSDNELLLTSIKNAIPQQEGKHYEACRIADRQEVFTKELLQIEFFYYLSSFFNKYFAIKRRGLLTNLESEIIGYFLKWFRLSPSEVSTSRLRQLRMNFNKVGMGDIFSFSLNGEDVKFQWQFIKYSDWSKGKINPLNHKINAIEELRTIRFPPNIKGLDLLKR